MIDNPLPDQVMQELDMISKAAHFEDCCKTHAKEIALCEPVKELEEYVEVEEDEEDWV